MYNRVKWWRGWDSLSINWMIVRWILKTVLLSLWLILLIRLMWWWYCIGLPFVYYSLLFSIYQFIVILLAKVLLQLSDRTVSRNQGKSLLLFTIVLAKIHYKVLRTGYLWASTRSLLELLQRKCFTPHHSSEHLARVTPTCTMSSAWNNVRTSDIFRPFHVFVRADLTVIGHAVRTMASAR